MNHNLFDHLRAAFPRDYAGDISDALAIETADDPSLSYSWRDLDHGTAMLANLLDSLQLPSGSRVVVQADKSVEALMLYLAVLRAGLVYVPLNTAYREAEMTYFIGDAEPGVAVCSGANFGWVSKIAFTAGTAHVFTLNDDRSGSLLQRAAHHSTQHSAAHRQGDDLAAVLYTSGTTGRSKGAMLSHGNLLSNALTLKAYWGWQPGDVLIHALPIFHVHGLFVAIHGALLNGSRMIWFNRFDAKAVVGRLPDATVFMGVPTLYVRLLGEPDFTRDACRCMRVFISGSAPLLIDTFNAFRERSGHTILERYGMSETIMLSSNPFFGGADDPSHSRRGGTVGRALPGVGIRVIDANGAPCPTHAIGGIEVHGPNVFQGYWRMPEKTREEFTADGWFRTGDLGQFDADGYLRIVGRSKDLVISGGYNVYPAEIEGYLNELPGIAESAVIGVPHADFGEAVVAVVVLKADAIVALAALAAALKARIAGFKVPKHLFVVDELPRNAMGKVQKNVLRDQYSGLFSN